jgi:Na+-translocating ferredoxin:NAD+ oxidoreductase RnfG subunit
VRRDDLCEPVLERVVSALGARVDLPLDRLADAQLVAGAVAAAARRHAADGELQVDLDAADGVLRLTIGALPRGGGGRVMSDSEIPGLGAVLERLVDRWTVESGDGGGERLVLAIGADGPGAS